MFQNYFKIYGCNFNVVLRRYATAADSKVGLATDFMTFSLLDIDSNLADGLNDCHSFYLDAMSLAVVRNICRFNLRNT